MLNPSCQQLNFTNIEPLPNLTLSPYDCNMPRGKRDRKMSSTERARARFGARLKAHREEKCLSKRYVAKMTGISDANLGMIESGGRPASDGDLEKIASVPEMEITFDQLVAWRIMAKAEPPQMFYLRQELEKMGIDFPDAPSCGNLGFSGT